MFPTSNWSSKKIIFVDGMQFKQFQRGSLKNFCSGFDGIRTHAPTDTSWALKPTELQSHAFGARQILFHLEIEIRISCRKDEPTKICLAPNVWLRKSVDRGARFNSIWDVRARIPSKPECFSKICLFTTLGIFPKNIFWMTPVKTSDAKVIFLRKEINSKCHLAGLYHDQ